MGENLAEILPGIYRLELCSKFKSINKINIFIIPGKDRKRDRSLMVDVGFHDEDCMMNLERAVNTLGISFDRLDLFLTHKHHDHCGLAYMVERLGTRIFMNPKEERHHYDCLHYNSQSYEDQARVLRFAGITKERTPKLWDMFTAVVEEDTLKEFHISQFHYIPISPQDSFCYGGYKLEAVPLKGHTLGQMGLAEHQAKLFFSGDQIIQKIVPIVATSYKDEHLLKGYFDSLKYVKEQLGGYRLFPSHNTMLAGENLQKTIDHIVFAYLEKIQLIRQLVLHGRRPMTVVQIAMLAYGVQELPKNREQFVFLKMITSKTFSCLEYLLDEDFVTREERNGVLYWEAG
ncbi:MAG: MBL fold metallo-hydrolase [Lachnospiraceae bacterium]|jgi:glyoxylase-like metal-dependent hydrolase (beta-lactamase superfamily II)|nr:MBL fold metallo-hydrolase [Lachnospiraceae bacterium]